MTLEEEVTQLIDSEALGSDAAWHEIAGLPSGLDKHSQELAALAAYCKGLRFAIRRLAREVEQVRGNGFE